MSIEEAFNVSPVGYSEESEPDVINNTPVDRVVGVSGNGESVVGLTRLFECTEDYYNQKKLDPDEFFEYTIYLVNHGTTLDDGTKQNTDMFFGSRKLTDFLVVSEYPGNTDYPNDKIYLVPKYENDVVVGYSVYFKSNDIVVPLQTSSISSIHYDEEGNYIQIVFKTEEGEIIPANILLVDDDGNLYPNNLQQVASSVVDLVIDQVIEEIAIYWDYI